MPYTQDSGTLAYLLELSPIFASCHHRFCIEDFPSPNPSRFKPRPYRGISIKNRDKTNTTWPTKNSSHNESNPTFRLCSNERQPKNQHNLTYKPTLPTNIGQTPANEKTG